MRFLRQLTKMYILIYLYFRSKNHKCHWFALTNQSETPQMFPLVRAILLNAEIEVKFAAVQTNAGPRGFVCLQKYRANLNSSSLQRICFEFLLTVFSSKTLMFFVAFFNLPFIADKWNLGEL